MIEIDANLIKAMLRNGKRIDNRKSDEYREISIKPEIVQQAEGSAEVRLGNTHVVAGIKMSIGTPYSDSIDKGVMSVSAEFVPFASPEFDSGPPSEESIELARVVDRAIRESKMVAFEKLCIKENEHVWMVNIDIDILSDDGNLIDAASLAAAAALMTAKMPKLEMINDKPVASKEERADRIPLTGIAVTTTFVKIGNVIVADPGLTEISAMDARLSIGTLDGKLCSMQKGGSVGLTVEEIEQMADMALEKGDELRKELEKLVLN
ncbi:MAG: exosome complex protein Rrp42 [Candidatus Aenigmarchaeota archaeon]|nr:exosome complex protein Rrp42 [Candidatus Aenigmarchaeota archaeon]